MMELKIIDQILHPTGDFVQRDMDLPVGTLDNHFDKIEEVAKKLGLELPINEQMEVYLKARDEEVDLQFEIAYRTGNMPRRRLFASSDLVLSSITSGDRNELSLMNDDGMPWGSGSFKKSLEQYLKDYHPSESYVYILNTIVRNLDNRNLFQIIDPFVRTFSFPQ